VKNNPLILNGFMAVSPLHGNPLVRQKIKEKSTQREISPHEAERRVFSFMDSHLFQRSIMTHNRFKTKSLLQFHGFIKEGQMKHEAGLDTKVEARVSRSEEFK
jgi:hypothetical protein